MTYLIIVCHNCGKLLLTKAPQKTRQCPHCQKRIHIERAKVVGSAVTAQEASKLIKTLKLRRE